MKKRILAIFMLMVVFITNIDFKLAKAYGGIFIVGDETSEDEVPKIKEYNGFKYYEEDGYIVIDNYVGKDEFVNIPAEIEGKKVKKLGEGSIGNTPLGINKVIIPNTVEEIGQSAFAQLTELKEIEIPESVKKIGEYAFMLTGLKSISIPDGVEVIGNQAFNVCFELEKVNLGKNVKIIGEEAFNQCSNLKKINLDNVETIGKGAFTECTNLEKIEFGKNLKTIESMAFNNCKNLKAVNLGNVKEIGDKAFFNCPIEKVFIPKTLEKIGEDVFTIDTQNIVVDNASPIKDTLLLYDYVYSKEKSTEDGFVYYEKSDKIIITGYTGRKSDLEIPEKINNKPIKEIRQNEDSSKEFKALTSLVIPKTVEKIGSYAFSMGEIKNLTLNEGLKEIGEYAFYYNNIKSLVIPSTVEKIGESVFGACYLLKNLTLQEGIKEIGNNAFEETNIKNVFIPKTLEKIGENVFSDINKENIEIDKDSKIKEELLTYKFISEDCFCKYYGDFMYYQFGGEVIYLKQYVGEEEVVEIPEEINGVKIKQVSMDIFSGTNVKKVIIPETVEKIDNSGFSKIKIEEVTIPKSVKTIAGFAFANCLNLKKVTLEDGIEEINNGAFLNAPIESIEIPKSITYMGDYVFSNIPKEKIKIDDNCKIKDELLNYYFVDYENIIDSFDYAHRNYKTVCTERNFEWALCKKYEDFTYYNEKGGVVIAEYNGKESDFVEIPDTINGKKVKKIKGFEQADSTGSKVKIKEIKIGKWVEEIGRGAFMGSKIETLTIPKNVKKIGEAAFVYCENLKSLVLEDGIEEIGSEAFFGTQIETVYIPKSIKSIGDNAFSGITKYKVYIDDELETKDTPSDESETKDTLSNYDFLQDDLIIKNIKVDKSIGIVGEPTSLEANVNIKEGSGIIKDNIQYNFEVIDSKGNIVASQGYIYKNKFIWTPEIAGEFKIFVSVYVEVDTDKEYDLKPGEVIIGDKSDYVKTYKTLKTIKYTVKDNLQDIKINNLKAEMLDEGTINVTAEGEGEGELQYEFYIEDKEGSHIIQEYSEKNSCMILTPTLTNGEKICVDIIDESNRIETKSIDSSSIKKSKNYEEDFNEDFNFSLKDVFITDNFEYNQNEDGTINILRYTGKNTTIAIPEKINGKEVTTIGNLAFDDCYKNTKIIIPKTIKNIASNAFNNCFSLKSIEVNKDNKYYLSKDGVLFNKDKTKLIRYPEALEFKKTYEIPEGVKTLEQFSFYNCKNISRIIIPKSVEEIENSSIYNCEYSTIDVSKENKNYKDIDGVLFNKSGKVLIKYPIGREESKYEVPEDVKRISSYAFFNTNIKSITIPDSVIEIGNMTFFKSKAENIILSNNIETTGDSGFRECKNLKEIKIPSRVKSIGNYAFNECTNLNSVSLPEGLIEIKNNAFNKCTSLTNINFPKTLYKINSYAFSECTSLEDITIYNGLKILGDYSFNRCTNLSNINIPYEFVRAGTNAFYGVKNSKVNGIRYDYQKFYTTKNNIPKIVFNN